MSCLLARSIRLLNIVLCLFFASLVVVLGFLLWNFPWITRYYEPIRCRETADCDMIMVVSDIHLKRGEAVPEKLVLATEKVSPECIIFTGDLIDYRKKLDNSEIESLVRSIFEKLVSRVSVRKIYYVLSTSSHDPKLKEKHVVSIGETEVVICPGLLELRVDGENYFFAHGDYACRHGTVARVLNRIAGKFGRKMFVENLAKRAYGIPREYWLFVGHTHMLGIDHKNRVANPGSWKSKIGISASKTYIVINRKEIKIRS